MSYNLAMSTWFNNGEAYGTTELVQMLKELGLSRYQIAGTIGSGIRYGFITVASRGYSDSENKIRTVYTR